ncbi:MAG: hypothetical protein LBV12_10875 [Puniceicoccales bacterium]|nr:hypothetical protein [Puniceicoccales bacterium]
MKITSIADKIIVRMAKDFVDTGNEYTTLDALCTSFPKYPRHMIIAAINMLRGDQLLTALDSDDEPNDIALLVKAIRHVDENTLMRKGYAFAKEVRQWF